MKYTYSEEQKKEIKEARKKNKNKRIEKKLQVLEMRSEGAKLKAVSEATGLSMSYVNRIVQRYFERGIESAIGNHYKGNRRNMSYEAEEAILAPYKTKAESGMMIDVAEIKEKYQAAVGHTIGNGQIYYVLKRHGWRKVMPRSRHPKKAKDEAIEASKKLKTE